MIGIYKITNLINGHCYIGQSIDIMRRWKTHINGAVRATSRSYKYPLQKAIRKYGVENFNFEILCVCSKSELIYKEQFYYDLYKPEYNQIYPNENPVLNAEIETRRQAIFKTNAYKSKCSKTPSLETRKRISDGVKNSLAHKKAHNTHEYKQKMYKIRQRGLRKNKPVVLYNKRVRLTFSSMSDCAKWLDSHTEYTSKNKVSKIKAVCDGERKSAFGFKYNYL